LTVHHIRPRLIGGANTQRNMVTLCEPSHHSLNRLANWLAAWLLWPYGALLLWLARWRARRAGEG
jgi:HNH endonuclease